MVKKFLPILCGIFLLVTSCSINKFALKAVSDTLTEQSGSTVFTGDNDPELIKDALPFALKTYESLLQANPGHRGLQLTTGSAYIMYANAFIHTPAEMLDDNHYKEQEEMFMRAKNLYLRGRDFLIDGLDLKYPGFKEALKTEDYKTYFDKFTKEDTAFLYWIAAGWTAAFSVDNFDFTLSVGIPKAAALMKQALKIDESFDNGAIHDFFISYYGSLPNEMGGSKEKAKDHFNRTIELCNAGKLSPYISYATSVCINSQNVEEFKEMLNNALNININEFPAFRLANTIHRKKAQWLLDNIDDFFLIEEDNNEN